MNSKYNTIHQNYVGGGSFSLPKKYTEVMVPVASCSNGNGVFPWVVLVNGEWSTSSDLGARERRLCINVVYSGGSTLIHQSDAYHDGSGHQVRLRVFSTRLDIFNALGYDETKITTITGFNNNGSTGVGYTPSVIAWLEKE